MTASWPRAGRGACWNVGAGIGALSQELLSRGFARATLVDASPAYQAVARRAASEPGLVDRMEFREGDFVDLAPQLAQADAVVLDRVVCCYPDWQPLLEAALAHGRRIVAFSYPRDRWIVRFVVRADNQLRRLTRRAFRSFVHPEAAMSALPAASGFRRASRGTTFVWNADVYVRENG